LKDLGYQSRTDACPRNVMCNKAFCLFFLLRPENDCLYLMKWINSFPFIIVMKAAFVIKRFCLSRLKSCSVAIQKGVDCCFENMNSNFEVWRRRKGWKQSAFLFSRCLEKMIFCCPGTFAVVIQKGVLFAFRMKFVVSWRED
jgi:hypothetical protein